MGTNVIVITVEGNKYKIEKNGMSDFALIGVMECILIELKGSGRKLERMPVNNVSKEKIEPIQTENTASPETKQTERAEAAKAEAPKATKPDEESKPVDVKNRILKAREAIRGLGGKVEDLDLNIMSDEELQIEFEELTNQYKRLVNSQPKRK